MPIVTLVLTKPDLKVATIRLAYAERGLAVLALGPGSRPPGGPGLVGSRH